MDGTYTATALEHAVIARLNRLHRHLFLVPVLAVAFVFVGINALRDSAQLRANAGRSAHSGSMDGRASLNVSVRGQMMRVLLLLAPWLSGGPLADIAAQLSA